MSQWEYSPSFQAVHADTLLGEGPLWCTRSRTLWWIDGSRPQLLRWRWQAERAESWALARPPAALALMADGRLLIAFRARFACLDEAGAPLRELTTPSLDLGDERFNDGKVDRMGRLWIGTIDRELERPLGRLRRIDAQGIHIMAEGFALSNGIGWSPDDRTLYFSESFERRIHRYRYDNQRGRIVPADDLTGFVRGAAKPDGLTVDAEGGIWCAVFGGGCVDRYLPDGRLDRRLRLPVSNPTSCMFGGPDLRTLFVTTAKHGLTPEQVKRESLAGSLLAIPMDVAGLPETPLASDCVLTCNVPPHGDAAIIPPLLT